MKVVKRFENSFSADLAKGMLENNGIDAWVLNPNQAFSTGATIGNLGIAMSIFEYDKEEEERKLRKAEYEAGELRGIEKGRRQEKQEIAVALEKDGMKVDKIASLLKLSKEQVQKFLEIK